MPIFTFVSVGLVIFSFLLSLLAPPAHSANSDLDRVQRLIQAGRMQEALNNVDAYLDEHPEDAQGLFKKGIIHAQLSQSEQAIAIFERLTQNYPELPEPYNNLAVLLSAKGEFEQARQVLLAAIEAHPGYATAHENLGDLYVNLAGRSYGNALQIERQNTKLQTKLAMINDLASPTQSSPPRNVVSLVTSASTVPMPTSDTQAVTVSLPQEDEIKLILATVDDWAQAWSAQDANAYLSFYAADFRLPANMSRASWETSRRNRIAKPKTISVVVDDPKVEFADSTDAFVTFQQTYRSDVYRDQVRKRLQLHKQGNHWQIYQELVLAK